MQELAGDEGRGLLRHVVAASPGRGQVRGNDAPRRDERLEGCLTAAGEDPEFAGEDHEAGDDQAKGDVRRPPRRIGVPQRDHGIGPSGLLGRFRGRLGGAALWLGRRAGTRARGGAVIGDRDEDRPG